MVTPYSYIVGRRRRHQRDEQNTDPIAPVVRDEFDSPEQDVEESVDLNIITLTQPTTAWDMIYLGFGEEIWVTNGA